MNDHNSADVYYSNAAHISAEKLEMATPGVTYVFDGIMIEEDKGILPVECFDILTAQLERDDFLPGVGIDLTLDFTDEIPRSITWYNHYYMTTNGGFLYHNLQQAELIDKVDTSVVLQTGLNLAAGLSSTYPPQEHYRIIRIVCEFDEKKVEYYIFSAYLSAKSPLTTPPDTE
ncbi:MAG: hypothetical protein FWG31_02945 [Oscillospiraceae bacterium]|nr:hypothetical protein [Oscillospiraceae bacterium]